MPLPRGHLGWVTGRGEHLRRELRPAAPLLPHRFRPTPALLALQLSQGPLLSDLSILGTQSRSGAEQVCYARSIGSSRHQNLEGTGRVGSPSDPREPIADCPPWPVGLWLLLGTDQAVIPAPSSANPQPIGPSSAPHCSPSQYYKPQPCPLYPSIFTLPSSSAPPPPSLLLHTHHFPRTSGHCKNPAGARSNNASTPSRTSESSAGPIFYINYCRVKKEREREPERGPSHPVEHACDWIYDIFGLSKGNSAREEP